MYNRSLSVDPVEKCESQKISRQLAVDEHRHVLAQCSVLVDDIAAKSRVGLEDLRERVVHGRGSDGRRWTRDVPLKVRGEDDAGHRVRVSGPRGLLTATRCRPSPYEVTQVSLSGPPPPSGTAAMSCWSVAEK